MKAAFPGHFLLAALFLPCAPLSGLCGEEQGKPSILLVLADDLGYGDVGCYNPESKVPTPRLDWLASQGLRFTDAHSPSTVCTPTRYSILTGRMAFRNGMRGVFTGAGGPCLIEEDRPTLPGLLQQAGYTTALIGKWHVGLTFFDSEGDPIHQNGLEAVRRIDWSRSIPDGPIDRGFDRFFGTACCPTTDWIYAYIEQDRVPVPPTELLDRGPLPKHPYSRDNRRGLIAPGFDLEEVDQVFLERSVAFLEEHARERPGQPFFLFHSAQAVHLPSFPAEQFKGRSGAGPHGDFIHQLDHIVGVLLDALERLGLAEDTLVLFTSDNGPEVTTALHMRRDHGHDGARPWRGAQAGQLGRRAPSPPHRPLAWTDSRREDHRRHRLPHRPDGHLRGRRLRRPARRLGRGQRELPAPVLRSPVRGAQLDAAPDHQPGAGHQAWGLEVPRPPGIGGQQLRSGLPACPGPGGDRPRGPWTAIPPGEGSWRDHQPLLPVSRNRREAAGRATAAAQPGPPGTLTLLKAQARFLLTRQRALRS